MSLRASLSLQRLSRARCLHTSSALCQAPVPIPTKPASQAKTQAPRTQLEQMERYPSHPLLQFFHMHKREVPTASSITTATENADGTTTHRATLPESVHQSDIGKDGTSRSWLAAELRLKSSKDLHTLWYVLLMERNRLATSWEELGRIGGRQAARMWSQNLGARNHRVRKSMARIKLVLNERRLALIQAQKQVRDAPQAAEISDAGPLFEDKSL